MYYKTDLDTHIILSTTDPDSYITYQVSIINTNNTTMYYDDIIYDSNHYSNPNIIVEATLTPGQAVESNQIVTFNVTYKYSDTYKATATAPYTNVLDSFTNFHFIDQAPGVYHTVSYIGFENTTNYPTSVLENSTLNVNFTSPVPTQIQITESNTYTYTNGVLTIPNVTSNITIENLSGYDFPVIDPDNTQPEEIHTPGIDSNNTIQVPDFLNQTYQGKNLSNQTINRVEAIITYTTSTGSKQSINMILTIGNQSQTKTVQFQGKQTNQTVPANFTGISIAPDQEFTISSSTNNLNNQNIEISDVKLVFYFAQN